MAHSEGISRASSALIDTMNTDLSRFFARGGRLTIEAQGSECSSNPHIVMTGGRLAP
jgi:hypothetical protein